MSKERDALIELMQPEMRDGILYKCFCSEFGIRDLTSDELWELFDVRWAALSEVRFDKGLEAFLMRDDIDSQTSTIQLAGLYPSGHVVGGLRVHIAPLTLLGDIEAIQISRVGVEWDARGAGIGAKLVGKALRIARALGTVKSLPLVFLLSRVLDSENPNRVLRFYERIGFRRTNLYTVTKDLSNCLMLAGVKQPSLQHLRSQGFQVEEAHERGAIYPTLLIASSVARQIQTAGRAEQDVESEDMQTFGLFLQGRQVTLRPFFKEDLATLHHWEHRREPPGYATISHTLAPTLAELEEHFERENALAREHRFAIETHAGRLIGQLLYFDLQPDTRNVSIDVMIGEPDFWEGTWGKEAVWLLVEYLFDRLGVHRIGITVSQLQKRLLRDLQELGFRHDGTLRDHEIAEGRYIAHKVLSILEDEYRYRS